MYKVMNQSGLTELDLDRTAPILFALGNGTIRDYNLPHRYVLVASLVIYINGTVYPYWEPLGGDAKSTCDAIRFDSALGNINQATARYRRKIKCVLRVEDKVTRRRLHRNQTINAESIYSLTFTLDEVAS